MDKHIIFTDAYRGIECRKQGSCRRSQRFSGSGTLSSIGDLGHRYPSTTDSVMASRVIYMDGHPLEFGRIGRA